MSNKDEKNFKKFKSSTQERRLVSTGAGREIPEDAAPQRRAAGAQDGSRQAASRQDGSRQPASRQDSERQANRRAQDEGAGNRRKAPAAAAAGKRKKKKWPIAVAIILAIVLGLGTFVFAQLGRIDRTRLSNILTNAGVSTSGYTNLVFFGGDSRDGNLTKETHSDTIMICSINNRTGEIKLASVYRDTYLDNTNGEYRKATEAYYFGGPERAINMLNTNLDLDIKDFVTVDFAAVIKIVDALGGIDLEITEEERGYINGYCVENKEVTGVDYTPLEYAGYVHLEGIQALAYCRIRYTEGWDYKRTERQRTVMNLCFEKAKQQGVTSMMNVANSLLGNIATSMSNTEILGLVGNMGKYSLGEQTGFPFDKMPANLPDGGDCVVPVNLANNVSQLHAFLFGQEGYTVSDQCRQISDTIMNNTGIQ